MNTTQDAEIEKINSSIQMLKTYVKETNIEPLITALEALKEDPCNNSLIAKLSDAFKDVGQAQGEILTYAPYIGILVHENPFGD